MKGSRRSVGSIPRASTSHGLGTMKGSKGGFDRKQSIGRI